jgi:hypothetical protein
LVPLRSGNDAWPRSPLTVGVPLYVAWAVLLDAAIHGWDDLKLIP